MAKSYCFMIAALAILNPASAAADWLWIDKCRQDDCNKTWVLSKQRLSPDIYKVKTRVFEFKFQDVENPEMGPPRTDYTTVSCVKGDSYVEFSWGDGYRVEEPRDGTTHSTEDADALWNAICLHKYDTVN